MSAVNPIEALRAALPKLNASDVEFATSLLAKHRKYGNLSPMYWVGEFASRADKPEPQKKEVGDPQPPLIEAINTLPVIPA